MKTVVYVPSYNEKHRAILTALAEGIPGAEVRELGDYVDSDVAVIFGGWKRSFPATDPKREILEKHTGRRLLMVESGFVRRGEYYQVGWGGFAGDADFNAEEVGPKRWKRLKVPVSKWRKNPDGLIVVCGQVPWDTQVQDTNHRRWCRMTVEELDKRYPGRVVFCPHPRERHGRFEYGIPRRFLRPGAGLHELMESAACIVTWNSTSSVDAVLLGTPAITLDPSAYAWPVTQHSLDDIEQLEYPDRTLWLNRMGYALWTVEEMRRGLPWAHLTRS